MAESDLWGRRRKEIVENEHLWISMAKKLVRWWEADKPETTIGYDAAHELGGVVQLAQTLLDVEESRKETKKK